MNKFEYYESYKWPKCDSWIFHGRVAKWMEWERAIFPWKYANAKIDTSAEWRNCRWCNKFHKWEDFIILSGWINWRGNLCPSCIKLDKQELQVLKNRKYLPKKTAGRKKEEPKSEIVATLDAMYENDPITKNNKRIIWELSPEKDFINKIHYLQSRWFSSDALSQAYKVIVYPPCWENRYDWI